MPKLREITTLGYGKVTQPTTITLEVTPEMMATLRDIARDSGSKPLSMWIFTRRRRRRHQGAASRRPPRAKHCRLHHLA